MSREAWEKALPIARRIYASLAPLGFRVECTLRKDPRECEHLRVRVGFWTIARRHSVEDTIPLETMQRAPAEFLADSVVRGVMDRMAQAARELHAEGEHSCNLSYLEEQT